MFKTRFLLVAGITFLIFATSLGLFLAQPANDPPGVSSPVRVKQDTPAIVPKEKVTSSSAIKNDDEKPFWEEAEVPDPGFDEPAAVAIVPKPSSPIMARDYAAEVRAFEKDGQAGPLNDSLMLWFNQDPTAATEWINETERFEDISPSLHSLAQGIAHQGHLDTALTWADSIPDPAQRHETLLRIYAHEARQRRVTRETLQQQGFSQEDITVIFSGELGD